MPRWRYRADNTPPTVSGFSCIRNDHTMIADMTASDSGSGMHHVYFVQGLVVGATEFTDYAAPYHYEVTSPFIQQGALCRAWATDDFGNDTYEQITTN